MASGEVSREDKIKADQTTIAIAINNITGELDKLTPTSKSYIFKVHPDQRSVHEKAYEPVLLSIGPYHYHKRNSDQLRYVEQQKLRYLNDLIKRKEAEKGASRSDQLKEYLGILEKWENEARGFYAEAVNLKKNEFLEMMLLDGCFIIELFRRDRWEDLQRERESDPLFKNDRIDKTLVRDLILLENQIPFVVLERLYSVIGDTPDDPLSLIEMAVNCLPNSKIARDSINCPVKEPSSSRSSPSESRQLDPEKLKEFKHLLDLVYRFMLVGEILEKKEEGASPPKQEQGGWTIWKFCGGGLRTSRAPSDIELRDHGVHGVMSRAPSDIELRDHGVMSRAPSHRFGVIVMARAPSDIERRNRGVQRMSRAPSDVELRDHGVHGLRAMSRVPSMSRELSDVERRNHGVVSEEEILQKKEEGASPQMQSQKKDKTTRTLSAAELRDHGVTFEKAERREFYRITFEKGILKIPVIQIDDDTEVRFRNMIAYEEHCVIGEHTYIKDYVDFMDGLVNTPKDVELLRRREIIKSFMGDDETIATVFNKMCKNVVLSRNSYYEKIADDLSEYCKSRRHAWMAKFRENYLSSPWAFLSVLAASILLILTMTQTVYTALSYYNAK